MGRNLAKRFLVTIVSFFILANFCFFVFRALPGGPFDEEVKLPQTTITLLEKEFGLHQPFLVQLKQFNLNLFNFNLGSSYQQNISVQKIVLRAVPLTLKLGGLSLLVIVIAATLLLFFGYFKNPRRILYGAQIIVSALQTLVIGPILIFFFVFKISALPLLPTNNWLSWVLPVFILSLRPTLNLVRIHLTAIEENLHHPSSLVMQGYGHSSFQIWRKWALKGSWGSVFAYFPQLAAHLLSGSLFVELIFGIQGLGTLFFESLKNRDFPVLIAITLFFGAMLLFLNFVFECLHEYLDPRVKESLERSS